MKNGEIKLNASERLKEFTQGIQNYIDCKNLGPPKFTAEYVLPEMFTTENLERLTQDECFNSAFMLYQYADYVNSEKGSQEVVIKWCEKALNTIICTETDPGVSRPADTDLGVSRPDRLSAHQPEREICKIFNWS